jgi:hypothetical protein
MSDHKPRFLLRSSPLVAGGKARLMSNKKVEPKPATPREVSRIEAQGYTTEPHKGLQGEPECVGPAIVDAYGELARSFDALRHAADVEAAQQSRRLLDAEQRVTAAQARAKQRHMDMSGEFHAIGQMLKRAKDGGRREPNAAIRRLERVEAKLDGEPDKWAA